MKNLLLFTFMSILLIFSSCTKKEKDIEPVITEQVVTINVDCRFCYIEVQDNNFNYLEEKQDRQFQSFVAGGKFNYEFTNEKLSEITVRITVSVFHDAQRIKASIKTNDNKIIEINRMFGSSLEFEDEYPYERELVLKLK